jgi:hypothetical protein
MSAAGFSTGTIEEAHATRAIMQTSRRTIVVADRSKFNVVAFAWIAELQRIEHFVTDATPDDALRAALEEAEVEILVCDSDLTKAVLTSSGFIRTSKRVASDPDPRDLGKGDGSVIRSTITIALQCLAKNILGTIRCCIEERHR